MDICLIMVVRNEAHGIRKCLDAVMPLVKEAIIVDTGSDDGTPYLIEKEYGVKVEHFAPPQDDCYNIVPARNYGLSLATQPWILTLDADEILTHSSLQLLKDMANKQESDGFFGHWINYRNGKKFLDYKLFLFKNFRNISFLGRVHAVPQTSMRLNKLKASFLDELSIEHCQVGDRQHRYSYEDQIKRGINENPKWIRYHWFLGYAYAQKHDLDNALYYLQQAAFSASDLFPVESLNAAIVMTDLLIKNGRQDECHRILKFISSFLSSMSSDFEVQINEYYSWLQGMERALVQHEDLHIQVPLFAY